MVFYSKMKEKAGDSLFSIGFANIQRTDACFSFKNEPHAPLGPRSCHDSQQLLDCGLRRPPEYVQRLRCEWFRHRCRWAGPSVPAGKQRETPRALFGDSKSCCESFVAGRGAAQHTFAKPCVLCATHVGEAPCADSNVLWGNHCGLRSQAPTSFRQPALRTCVSSSCWARACLPNRNCRLGSIGTYQSYMSVLRLGTCAYL